MEEEKWRNGIKIENDEGGGSAKLSQRDSSWKATRHWNKTYNDIQGARATRLRKTILNDNSLFYQVVKWKSTRLEGINRPTAIPDAWTTNYWRLLRNWIPWFRLFWYCRNLKAIRSTMMRLRVWIKITKGTMYVGLPTLSNIIWNRSSNLLHRIITKE